MSRRVAMVTGAAQGIGRAIAVAFAAEGYHVGLTSHQSTATTEAAVRDLGGTCVSIVRDLAEPGAGSAVVDEIVDRLGGIDVLVNNAGITLDRAITDTPIEEFDRIIGVNLRATFETIRACVRPMQRAGGGAVVNISSIHSGHGMPGHGLYASSKGGVDAMTRTLAVELAHLGIRVNAVAPGLVKVARIDLGDAADDVLEQIPLRRAGVPDDVAAAVLFLAGPAGTYITGQVLRVDGGLSAKMAFAF